MAAETRSSVTVEALEPSLGEASCHAMRMLKQVLQKPMQRRTEASSQWPGEGTTLAADPAAQPRLQMTTALEVGDCSP